MLVKAALRGGEISRLASAETEWLRAREDLIANTVADAMS